MYFVLYDKDLSSIGSTYIMESWSRTERAVDFDDIRLIGEKIPYSADPFLVVANNKHGRMMFSGLASTPVINEKEKKTVITLKDYATLFNTEIIVDWSKFSGNTLSDYINFIFDVWLGQITVGFPNIECDTTAVSDLILDTDISLGTDFENVLVHDLIFDAINYYNIYYKTSLDIKSKTLTFQFLPAAIHTQDLKISDVDSSGIEKSFGEYNRATVYDSDYNRIQEWALTEDNSIVKLPTTKALVYPAKNRNFVAKKSTEEGENSLYNAIYEAAMGLAQNRYQENLDLNAQQYRSIIDLTVIDFSYNIQIFTSDGFYKSLPVGEIETDSSGKHIVRLGYRIQELTQEI